MQEMAQSKQLKLDSSEALLAYGPHVLYEHLADSFESALGRSMPQVEIRVNDLSLSADVTVADEDAPHELPTITNALKRSFVVAKKHVVHKEILKNVTAVFKPGTITLVLGQPGSGKSALMKTLSGRFPMTKNIKMDGRITYNDQELDRIRSRVPQFVAYVSQRDHHYPSLTVKETLTFAHLFSGGEILSRGNEYLVNGTPEENRMALDAARAMFQHYPEVMIQQLGLQNCQDTIVGDTMSRGVSGGERKRVTTGEMEFGMKYATFMDEISTGLDSAATYDIISTQRSIAKCLGKTVVISLLQPSPEIFALFDDVIILNEGEVMYHGPREQVATYFEGIGFVCPPKRDIADYLLDLGTSQQFRYQDPSQQNQPRSASEFAESFRRSSIFQETLRSLEEPHNPSLLMNVEAHMDPMPEFQLSFWESFSTLMKRESLVNFRNTAFIHGRIMLIATTGFLYASTYWQFDPTDVNVVIGIIFMALLFMANAQIPQIPVLMAGREIFYKQRGANFFSSSAYVLACLLSQLPLAFVESVVFGSVVYWACGLESNIWNYLQFEIIMFLTNMTFSAWFFFVAAISPSLHIANPITMVSTLVFLMFSGFNVIKDSIPDYFIWLYWISPLTWAIRATAIIQYRSESFSVCEYGGINYCETTGMQMGEYYLSLFGLQTEKSWVWLGMIVLVALCLMFIFLSCLVLEYKRYESPENINMAKNDLKNDEDNYIAVKTPTNSGSSRPSRLPLTAEAVMEVSLNDSKFVPVTLAFKDLWYSVPSPSNPKESINLLKGISGYALPGTMTALMGSSGAGKTTLMDVIAGRKTGGQIQGKILLNGYEASDLAIRRCTGYCEQMDIHMETSTIREALTFSAFLRQDSSIPDSKKYDSVSECLDLLGLDDIADQIVRGSSVEQMKRLTIGVELAADPSVLFLDEPTSGLDARYAKKVMDGVQKVANTGRTVVCTIHQPSSEVFFLFDSLLLLKRGGETVFFGNLGDHGRLMVDYFESLPGVEPLTLGYNPAAWMLECIGAGVNNSSANDTDFVELFNKSEHKQTLSAVMSKQGVSIPSPDFPELIFTAKRAATSYTQMVFLIRRHFRLYWRTASYNLTRIVISLGLALLFGLVFAGGDYTTYAGINSGVSVVFNVAMFSGWVSFQSIVPMTFQLRTSFYRERASQTYNAFWYFVGETIAEIPYVFTSGFVFTVIFFPMVGFSGFWTGVQFWLVFSLIVLGQTYFGMLIIYALPSMEVASVVGTLVNSTFFLFGGFNPPSNAIPTGYKWLHGITPQRFPISIITSLVFCNCPNEPTWDDSLQQFTNIGSELGCQPLSDAPVTMGHITVKGFVEEVFEYKYDRMVSDLGFTFLTIIIFRVLGLLALRCLNHQKR